MTRMRFNVKEARRHLIDNGYVLTLRKWNGYPSICEAIYNQDDQLIKLFKIKVSKLRGNIEHADDLEEYYEDSGFATPAQWWNRAISLGANNTFVLYKVKKI